MGFMVVAQPYKVDAYIHYVHSYVSLYLERNFNYSKGINKAI